jgi:hypothetical protein
VEALPPGRRGIGSVSADDTAASPLGSTSRPLAADAGRLPGRPGGGGLQRVADHRHSAPCPRPPHRPDQLRRHAGRTRGGPLGHGGCRTRGADVR